MLESESEYGQDVLFEILNHLNKAQNIIGDDFERIKIAGLNLKASLKAQESTAYQSAVHYAIQGIQFLPQNCWEVQYELTFALYRQSAECQVLSMNFEEAASLFPILFEHAKTIWEKVSIYVLKVAQFDLQFLHKGQIEMIQEGLKLLGINLPITEGELKEELPKAKFPIATSLKYNYI
jgi:predicted ATPase